MVWEGFKDRILTSIQLITSLLSTWNPLEKLYMETQFARPNKLDQVQIHNNHITKSTEKKYDHNKYNI